MEKRVRIVNEPTASVCSWNIPWTDDGFAPSYSVQTARGFGVGNTGLAVFMSAGYADGRRYDFVRRNAGAYWWGGNGTILIIDGLKEGAFELYHWSMPFLSSSTSVLGHGIADEVRLIKDAFATNGLYSGREWVPKKETSSPDEIRAKVPRLEDWLAPDMSKSSRQTIANEIYDLSRRGLYLYADVLGVPADVALAACSGRSSGVNITTTGGGGSAIEPVVSTSIKGLPAGINVTAGNDLNNIVVPTWVDFYRVGRKDVMISASLELRGIKKTYPVVRASGAGVIPIIFANAVPRPVGVFADTVPMACGAAVQTLGAAIDEAMAGAADVSFPVMDLIADVSRNAGAIILHGQDDVSDRLRPVVTIERAIDDRTKSTNFAWSETGVDVVIGIGDPVADRLTHVASAAVAKAI